MNVYEKLMVVQLNLNAPKQQFNSFGNYSYRNCEDILEAAKPCLREVNCIIVINDEIVLIGDRHYIKATATFIDCESNERVVGTAYAREEATKKGMDTAQVTGATSSYARKYALNGLLCIDDCKDADSRINSSKYKDLLIEFSEEINRTGKSVKYFVDLYKVSNMYDIKESDMEKAIKALKELPDKKESKQAKQTKGDSNVSSSEATEV